MPDAWAHEHACLGVSQTTCLCWIMVQPRSQLQVRQRVQSYPEGKSLTQVWDTFTPYFIYFHANLTSVCVIGSIKNWFYTYIPIIHTISKNIWIELSIYFDYNENL